MEQKGRLIVIAAPSGAYAQAISDLLTHVENGPVVELVMEPVRAGKDIRSGGEAIVRRLQHARTLVVVSHDPQGLVSPRALATADLNLVVSRLDRRNVRRLIRLVTGLRADGLELGEVHRLDVPDLTAAVRSRLRPTACVRHLHALLALARTATSGVPARTLEEVHLPAEARKWAEDMAEFMRRVGSGGAAPEHLLYPLLEGPPGTGKTTAAAALAGSAGWAFERTNVGQWFQQKGDLGGVTRAASDFFGMLRRREQPVVALLDEIDSLPSRYALDPEEASWWTPVINHVLSSIDQLKQSGRPIVLMGATNHFDRLDPALIRPGRLEVHVRIDPPDQEGRCEIIRQLFGSRLTAKETSTLARVSVGATPAAIESWARAIANRNEPEGRPLFEILFDIAVVDNRSARQRRAVAVHESGHAIVAHVLGLPIRELSIARRGVMGGWMQADMHDQPMNRDGLERLVTVLLGGRAAEILLGEGADAGAVSDLEQARELLELGYERFGLYGPLSERPAIGTQSQMAECMAAPKRLEYLLGRACAIVERCENDLLRLAECLEQARVIEGGSVRRILDNVDCA